MKASLLSPFHQLKFATVQKQAGR